MDEQRLSGKKATDKADEVFDSSVDLMAENYLAEEEKGYDSELEPFESYAKRVREEIHENMTEFRNRFLLGYELLLEELSAQHAGQGKSGEDIPPNAIKL